jgi:hypothetical protein
VKLCDPKPPGAAGLVGLGLVGLEELAGPGLEEFAGLAVDVAAERLGAVEAGDVTADPGPADGAGAGETPSAP